MNNNNILLVEDNYSEVMLFTRALKKMDTELNFDVARDGVEAIERLNKNIAEQKKQPNLMILDLKMPRMNGFEVLERMKQNPHLKNIPVVIFSASNQQEDIKKAYSLGTNSYLVKPYEFHELVESVRNVTGYWLSRNITPEPGK